MRSLPFLNEKPRFRQDTEPGRIFLTTILNGEPKTLGSTRRDITASVGLGQPCSPQANGGELCARMT